MRNGVLVTRPATEHDPTLGRLITLGLVPVHAPLLEIERRCFRAPARFDAILVTSSNALAALSEHLSTPLLAVGDATAERARLLGFDDVRSASGNAEDLFALAQSTYSPGATLLLATGAGQGSWLAQKLRTAGMRVQRRVAYASVPVRMMPAKAVEALGCGRLRSAIFLSAETARVFVRLLPRSCEAALMEVDALVISRTTWDVLTPLPWRRVRVSLAPSLEQVLALL